MRRPDIPTNDIPMSTYKIYFLVLTPMTPVERQPNPCLLISTWRSLDRVCSRTFEWNPLERSLFWTLREEEEAWLARIFQVGVNQAVSS